MTEHDTDPNAAVPDAPVTYGAPVRLRTDHSQLLRHAGVAIRMCFEPATRELLEGYVEELDNANLTKLAAAADELHTTALTALGRRHS